MTWLTPHTSCRYVVGVHWAPADMAPGRPPRTLIAAVHEMDPEAGKVLASAVLGSGDDSDPTHYAMPKVYPMDALTAFAPNLGEARKLLHALLAARGAV